MKLIKKTRYGSKVRRVYDQPQTPYQRVLQSPAVDAEVKSRLKQQYETLNPVALKRELTRLTDHLLRASHFRSLPLPRLRHPHCNRYSFTPPSGVQRNRWPPLTSPLRGG